MRVMYLVKSNHPGPPTPELGEAMQKLADREIKAGRMLDNGGLMPVSAGAQVRIQDGQLSLIDGPFVEAKEVVGGFAVFELRDKDEAIDLRHCQISEINRTTAGRAGETAAAIER